MLNPDHLGAGEAIRHLYCYRAAQNNTCVRYVQTFGERLLRQVRCATGQRCNFSAILKYLEQPAVLVLKDTSCHEKGSSGSTFLPSGVDVKQAIANAFSMNFSLFWQICYEFSAESTLGGCCAQSNSALTSSSADVFKGGTFGAQKLVRWPQES